MARPHRGTVTFDTPLMDRDRVSMGWNLRQLAEVANIPYLRVVRFFNGDYQAPSTAKAIADALGKPLGMYLRSGSEELAS